MIRFKIIPPLVLGIALVLSLSLPCSAQDAQTPAAEPTEAKAENLKVTITAVNGTVQHRTAPEQPWVAAQVGTVLDAGADLRTGVRSSVTLHIEPQQDITLDRLGTVRILEVLRDPQKTRTNLGMKYGRTRVKLETGGREHETTVSTPGATLAVRGSDATIQHDPLVSFAMGEGHLEFLDPSDDRVIAFGGDGDSVAVDGDHANPGTLERGEATIDPGTSFGGRDGPGQRLLEEHPENGGEDYRARNQFAGIPFLFGGGVQGGGEQPKSFNTLLFDFRFFDGADNISTVAFSVTDPSGFTMNFANPATPDGIGILEGDGVQRNGLGEIFATYGGATDAGGSDFRPGLYIISASIQQDPTTKEIGLLLDGFQVIRGEDVTVLNFATTPPARMGFLQPGNDTFTTSVNVPQ